MASGMPPPFYPQPGQQGQYQHPGAQQPYDPQQPSFTVLQPYEQQGQQAYAGYPQVPQGFGSQQQQQHQQTHNQPYGGVGLQGQGYPAQGFSTGQPAPDQAFAIPGLNAPGLNPFNFIPGSGIFGNSQNWGQQYVNRVQQRIGLLSLGTLNYHFAISSQYVRLKLLMLLTPYFKKWTFTRQPEQIQGGQKYRPPKVDVNSPDLYIPLTAAWAYIMLIALNSLLLGKFKPDMMYNTVWYTAVSWAVHAVVASLLLRAMSLPSTVPWAELFAYTGYAFVPCCITLSLGMLGGKWAWWTSFVYGGLCSAVFLVRTMKRVLFQEARSYGANLTLTNYLLLGLVLFQFPYLYWMASVPLPHTSLLSTQAVAAALKPPGLKV